MMRHFVASITITDDVQHDVDDVEHDVDDVEHDVDDEQ